MLPLLCAATHRWEFCNILEGEHGKYISSFCFSIKMERKSFLSILQSRGDVKNPRLLCGSPSTLADRITKYFEAPRRANAKQWPVEMHIRSTEVTTSPEKIRIKAYNLSDMHADAKDNLEWVRTHCVRQPEDSDVFTVFIIPGDIGSEIKSIRSIFKMLIEQYDVVIYVPGNHEAWCQGIGGNGTLTGATDSVLKLAEIISMAQACGVHTGPVRVSTADSSRALCIYPLYSWYHAGWDTEPVPQHPMWKAVEEALPFAKKWSDFSMCRWPADLVKHDSWATTAVSPDAPDHTVLAEMFATLNEPFMHRHQPVTASVLGPNAPLVQPGDTVITFSHFLPREELLPEKRFVMEPLLSRVVGSDVLESQVRRLHPHLHLFGHTHIPIDLELDGIRYVQWPLGYTREATMQCHVVRADGALLCYDSALGTGSGGIPADMSSATASWSAYYRNNAREANVVGPLAPWVLQRLGQYEDVVDKAHDRLSTPPVQATAGNGQVPTAAAFAGIGADAVFNLTGQRSPMSPKSPLLVYRGVHGDSSRGISPAVTSPGPGPLHPIIESARPGP